MKHLSLFAFAFALLMAAIPALAQQNNPDLILLNDATPAIDVVITLPPDTTGTIALDLALAAVTLTDANDAVVFTASDERLHGLEFNIAPNSGTHTLTIERLPDVAEAFVNVVSLPEMTVSGAVELVDGNTVSLNQEATLSLNGDSPGGTVTVDIPTETTGVITATFPGAFATTQLVDAENIVLAESSGGHVDALTFLLDGGSYEFTVLGNDLSDSVVVGVRAISSEDGGFVVIQAPAAPADAVAETTSSDCNATVIASSANLRSGPGTGYSVLGYAYRGLSYPIGGQNQERNWIVVGMDDGGSAWLSLSAAQMHGDCNTLTVFDIPTRDAASAQISIISSSSYDDDDHYEHEEDEHDTHEYEHVEDEHDEHEHDD